VPLGQVCSNLPIVGVPCCNQPTESFGIGAHCAHVVSSKNPLTFCLDGSPIGNVCGTDADCAAHYQNPQQDVACENTATFGANCPLDVGRCCVQKPCGADSDCPISNRCCKSLVGDRCCAPGQDCIKALGCITT
jgi:hypothetical protein